jgi:small Trp-rich protein
MLTLSCATNRLNTWSFVMYFLIAGVLALLLKYLEIGFVANWEWWQCLIPFGLAAVFWTWADASGYTKRKAVEKENARKQARIDKSKVAMGIDPHKTRIKRK